MTNAAKAKLQEEREDISVEAEVEHLDAMRGSSSPAAELSEVGFDDSVPSWFTRKLERDQNPQQEADNDVSHAPQSSYAAPQFQSSYIPLTPAQQTEANEAYRRRLEERFQLAQQMATNPAEFEPVSVPPRAPVEHHAPQGFPQRPYAPQQRMAQHYGYFAASSPQTAKSSPLGVSVPVALLLLSVASCIGALGGYVSANPGVAANMMSASFVSLWPFGGKDEPAQVAVTEDTAKKDMPSARVNVADIQGDVNAPIPLDISAYPAEPGTPLALKITGLPGDAYLTKGQQVAEGEWLIRAEDIRSAELVVKSSEQAELGLLVTALEADSGAAAAPAKSMKVALNLEAVPAPGLVPPPAPEQPVALDETQIVPVNAPPENALPKPVATPDRFLQEETANYVEKGEMLLKVGDIVAARQFFMRAYELKSPDGAYGVARTYDPVVYLKLNVQGLKPDAGKAAEWYGKAAAQGHEAAQAALAQPPQ